jgi:hypothetical protein
MEYPRYNNLASEYDPFPPPSLEATELADTVSGLLLRYGISVSGVIAVATFEDKEAYVGLSAHLQAAVQAKWGRRWGPILGAVMYRTTMNFDLITFCSEVSEQIIKSANINRGCAEKKIVTRLLTHPKQMLSLRVIPHPPGHIEALIAHVIQGETDGNEIGPCTSCRNVAQAFLKRPKND